MPARFSECFVEEGMVSVDGDYKFSPGVQDLKGRRNKGSERHHRLVCIIQFFCFVIFSWQIFLWVIPFYSNPQFPSRKKGKEGGKPVNHRERRGCSMCLEGS